jgi:hypothetical protein
VADAHGVRSRRAGRQPARPKETIGSRVNVARDIRRPAPRSAAAPRLESRRLAHHSEIQQRRDRPMMQSVQPITSHRPSCLLGNAAGAADSENHMCAGREINCTIQRRACVALAPVDDKPIRHELHRRLLLSMVATTVQECRLSVLDRMKPSCCDF